jgi:hypothetical protein
MVPHYTQQKSDMQFIDAPDVAIYHPKERKYTKSKPKDAVKM